MLLIDVLICVYFTIGIIALVGLGAISVFNTNKMYFILPYALFAFSVGITMGVLWMQMI